MLRVIDGGHSYTLEGRVAAMVRWLTERAERLSDHRKVKVEFNCAGRKVKPVSTVIEDGETIEIG